MDVPWDVPCCCWIDVNYGANFVNLSDLLRCFWIIFLCLPRVPCCLEWSQRFRKYAFVFRQVRRVRQRWTTVVACCCCFCHSSPTTAQHPEDSCSRTKWHAPRCTWTSSHLSSRGSRKRMKHRARSRMFQWDFPMGSGQMRSKVYIELTEPCLKLVFLVPDRKKHWKLNVSKYLKLKTRESQHVNLMNAQKFKATHTYFHTGRGCVITRGDPKRHDILPQRSFVQCQPLGKKVM